MGSTTFDKPLDNDVAALNSKIASKSGIYYKDYSIESHKYSQNGGTYLASVNSIINGYMQIGALAVASTGNTGAYPQFTIDVAFSRMKITNCHPDYELTVGLTVRVFYVKTNDYYVIT